MNLAQWLTLTLPLLLLAAFSIASFLPGYLLNLKEQPNPIGFLTDQRFQNQNKLKLLYAKPFFSDPIKINADFVVCFLMLSALNVAPDIAIWILASVFTIIQIEIIYTAVLVHIFKRPPVFNSDISLLKAGSVMWKESRLWICLVALVLILIIFTSGYFVSQYLYRQWQWPALANIFAILLILPPTLYNWRKYDYSQFQCRTFYSSLLHSLRNHSFASRFASLLNQDKAYFANKNPFRSLTLNNSPDTVHLCIESYGKSTLCNPDIANAVTPLLQEYEAKLTAQGWKMASVFSKSPIFTGGSWLSYATFMYGTKIDNLQLYDGLFQYSDNFGQYESLFHVLQRNGYENTLAAPLGGIDKRDVNWDSIQRCFQSHVTYDWEDVNFVGKRLNFFNQKNTFCMPDQYALNFAWQSSLDKRESSEGSTPINLFYCTLNSHFPFHSPEEAVADWRSLNDPGFQYAVTNDTDKPILERYQKAIRYQLDFALQFAHQQSLNAPVITLFGDHQPPFVASESEGQQTPVHILTKDPVFHQALLEAGLFDGLRVPENHPFEMNHEAYMSLYLAAMEKAWGTQPDKSTPFLAGGTILFSEGQG